MKKRRPLAQISITVFRYRMAPDGGPTGKPHWWTVRSKTMFHRTRPRGQPVQRHRRPRRPSGVPVRGGWWVHARPAPGRLP